MPAGWLTERGAAEVVSSSGEGKEDGSWLCRPLAWQPRQAWAATGHNKSVIAPRLNQAGLTYRWLQTDFYCNQHLKMHNCPHPSRGTRLHREQIALVPRATLANLFVSSVPADPNLKALATLTFIRPAFPSLDQTPLSCSPTTLLPLTRIPDLASCDWLYCVVACALV